MTEEQAKNKTLEIFELIRKATTNEQIDALIAGELIVNSMDIASYPPLGFKLEKDEVEKLFELGILNSDGNLEKGFPQRKKLTATEKLLYSVLWKNGDLKKIKHIVQGIQNFDEESTDKEDGLVFYQFGKFLTKTGQPIIDQHVLRAFKIYQTIEISEIKKFRIKGTIDKNDRVLIESYKEWLKSDELTSELRQQPEYSYHIDQLLFALGKTIKKRKTRGNTSYI